MNVLIITTLVISALGVVGLVILGLCSGPNEDTHCDEAIAKRAKERAERECKEAEKKAKEEAETKEKKLADQEKDAYAEEKTRNENKEWKEGGPDFKDIYPVGAMVNHIGQPCMVVVSENRSLRRDVHTSFNPYVWGIDWKPRPPLFFTTRVGASIWIQFPDQITHHKLSEADVELKITK